MATKVILEEEEIDRRINAAVKNAIGGKYRSKVYGVSGMGSENPIWTRTYDAAGITLTNTESADDADLIETTASDSEFQSFFDFPESTDEHGNVFITIQPLAFRFDRTCNGEVQAMSVKMYENGDEEQGFVLHPAFKKWTSETEWNGFGPIKIAKYISAPAYKSTGDAVAGEGDSEYLPESGHSNSDYAVQSKTGLYAYGTYIDWDTGMEIIKGTDESYCMFHWMYADLLRRLACIYFARADIWNFYGLEFTEQEGGGYESLAKGLFTGATDDIVSHTGFNSNTNQLKLFNLDDAFGGVVVNGCYIDSVGAPWYSHLVDTDANSDGGYQRSNLVMSTSYNWTGTLVTKFTSDANEPFFAVATAQLPITEDHPEDTVRNVFYCGKQKTYGFPSEGSRGGLQNLFCYGNNEIYPDSGLFYSFWRSGFRFAWSDGGGSSGGLRLCKEPE